MKNRYIIILLVLASILFVSAVQSAQYGAITCIYENGVDGIVSCTNGEPGYEDRFYNFAEAEAYYVPPMVVSQPAPDMVLVDGGQTQTFSGK